MPKYPTDLATPPSLGYPRVAKWDRLITRITAVLGQVIFVARNPPHMERWGDGR